MKKKDEIKVCLVGSSGGHLTHLYMLKPFWKDKNRFWVTFNKEDAKSLLEGEKVYPCYFPTNRSIKALIKNTKIAWNVLHKEKPDLIISCGAAVAVPFFYIGKMMGAKLVYIEVFDRIDKPTMTGKMVYAPNNNGSFLQAYALQTVLKNQLGGVENEIIDFYSEKQMRQYSVFRKPKSGGDIGRNLISLVHYKGLKSRHERFDQMRKKHLALSRRCAVEKEVYEVANAYDTLICGSDQIWNTEARDYSDAYFMTGVEKKKISYAASFGSHIHQIKNSLAPTAEDLESERRKAEIRDRIRLFEGIKYVLPILHPNTVHSVVAGSKWSGGRKRPSV